MALYLYRNPKTDEIREVIQSVHEEHKYSDGGVEWKREYTIPLASIDSKIDPEDGRSSVNKMRGKNYNLGETMDIAKEASERREKLMGRDEVREKAMAEYERKCPGKKTSRAPKKDEVDNWINMTILQNCGKLEIRESPIEGWGVFALDDIPKGTVLEEVPFITFPRYTTLGKNLYEMLNQIGFLSEKERHIDNLRQNLAMKDPEKYFFKFHPKVPLNGDPMAFVTIPLGFACLYNSSNTRNNAGWQVKEKTFVFRAEHDIKKDFEITTFFGYFLSENGQIYNCADVFNLAIDSFEGKHKCRAIRFGDVNQFEQSKSNASYIKLAQLLSLSKDGLSLSKIVGMLPNNEEKAAIDLGAELPISVVYQKLFEFRQSALPLIKIVFKFTHKDGQEMIDEVVFRK